MILAREDGSDEVRRWRQFWQGRDCRHAHRGGLQDDAGKASIDVDMRNGIRQETTWVGTLLKTNESHGRLLILALKSLHTTIQRSHVAQQVSNATIMDVPVA
jgi:hypothetical protein